MVKLPEGVTLPEGVEIKEGLEGVFTSVSRICKVDGQNGILIYSGYNINDLAKYADYEETMYLLFHDKLPNRREYDEFVSRLRSMRQVPQPVLDYLKTLNKKISPMHALRTAVSMLADFDDKADDLSYENCYRIALSLNAKISTLVAAIARIRKGLEPIPPTEHLNEAANFLYMLRGVEPGPAETEAIDMCLILHAEHGLNASTFTAKVCASSESDFYSATTAAIGSLKGPLHGGANTEVMEMLLEIGSVENVEPYIMKRLQNKQKIFGFGHRVYKTIDPRAEHLKNLSKALSEEAGNMKWYEISLKIQEVMRREMDMKGKPIYPNVDFFSASAYYTMGIELEMYTPIFAMSRMSGWCAHLLEQLNDNKLIRPRLYYIGKMNLPYIPIDQRE
ncbi:MAG: citrate synthase [Bacteroidia bacterium]|nr:citrate synthase [Bacteroidia bacterium]MDW8301307.1 citrate/2-methylcitrate synthase [Bacteroidia bacterium]